MSENKTDKKILVAFRAIDRSLKNNIMSSKEEEVKGRGFISWGPNNNYPEHIFRLSQDVTILRTIINGIADYVVGENVSISYTPWEVQVNSEGDTVEDIVRNVAIDLSTYGGFALNVIRNKIKKGIAEIYYLDFKKVRSDKKNEFLYYSDDWTKSYGRIKCNTYPKFRPDGDEMSSIFYYKNAKNSTYPVPPIAGDASLACQTEYNISEFHYNNLINGFSSSYILNFNNGVPDENTQEEIEDNLNDKFGGVENAGRMMVSFNDSKDRAVTVEKIDADDFGDRYQALDKATKQSIYSAYRAHPVLFGMPTETSGFNSQDFSEAFKLFSRTVVVPMQKVIKQAFEKILGEKDVVTIEPFKIDWEEDGSTQNVK